MWTNAHDYEGNSELSDGYGSIEYLTPIHPLPQEKDSRWSFGSTRSTYTQASNESDELLEQYKYYAGDSDDEEEKTTCSDCLFQWLGFQSSLLSDDSHSTRNTTAPDLRLSMLSNFSTAYNVLSISLALNAMDHIYETTAADKSLCSSALLAGMIVGQLVGGALGDLIGRHCAMAAVMFLQVFASLASTFSIPISIPLLGSLSVYQVLAIWRLILGLGCGGVYPLAATLTAESIQSSKDRAKYVALTFSCQGVGYLAVPIVAWLVATILHSDLAWRLILGLGALPGIVLTALRVRSQKEGPDKPPEVKKRQGRSVPTSIIDAIRMEESLVRKMFGTAFCWLLFDVIFYGNTLFEPVVLSSAIGASETVQKSAQDMAMIAGMAVPGYIVSVYAVGRQSPRWIQIQGFCVMGLLYLIVATKFEQLNRSMLLAVYGSTFFFSNYGPNATTYMLPSMTFSPPCRSTLNGVCAACGKVGALMGAALFLPASHSIGQGTVFLLCSFLSFIGAVTSMLCVSESVGQEEDVDECLPNEGVLDVPMKVVYSQPSFLDYRHAGEKE